MIKNYKDGEIGQYNSDLAPKIWELTPSNIRNVNSLGIFKEKIKFWTTDKCPCRLSKTSVDIVGFI